MKKIGIVLLTLVMIVPCGIRTQADTESFRAYFSYVGTNTSEHSSNQYYQYQDATSTSINLWQNDEVLLKIAVEATEEIDVQIECDGLVSKEGNQIKQSECGLLREASASLGVGDVANMPHVLIPEILTTEKEAHLVANQTRYFYMRIQTDKKQKPGTYTGTIRLQANTTTQALEIQLEVLDLCMPKENVLHLDLWQYPYSSLRYYDVLQDEEPFSEAHKEVLKEELQLYHALGGEVITTSILDEPWGHQTYDDYPSMIRWIRREDGLITFDYSAFDQYVSLCMELGIDDRINAFSILPFDPTITYDLESGERVRYGLSVGSQEWKDTWTHFLTMFLYHLEDMGWTDITYIFIDERDVNQVEAALDVIESIDVNGKKLHVTMAVNQMPRDNQLFDRIDSISVSVTAIPIEDINEIKDIIEHRKNLGLETTLYNCSTNYPNAFTISNPDESVWTMEYAYTLGFDGYLRWALNAWNENPYESLDYIHFEAGDIFLIYPDEKDATNPIPKTTMRLEMIRQGYRNVNKLAYLEHHLNNPTSVQETIGLMERGRGNFNAYGAMVAANADQENIISKEVQRIDTIINEMSHTLITETQNKPRRILACE